MWGMSKTLCNKTNATPYTLVHFPPDMDGLVRSYLGSLHEERLHWLTEHHSDSMFADNLFRSVTEQTELLQKKSKLLQELLPRLLQELTVFWKLDGVPSELLQEYQQFVLEIQRSLFNKVVGILHSFTKDDS